jgi:uncharacterized protein YjbI with pentapeptide repeats
MGANLDPTNVEALEKSVNDSAERVSTIWVSFLLFGLYLVIAAGGTTHRKLFLEEPVRLPALNIDLPLVGFFLIAPLLFVIFHAYVLVQVLLLARTAAAYDDAVERTFPLASDRARVRQRLANTLFAQIFAGSPREREGVLGVLLRLMAWLTLAFGPIVVLLTLEVMFLPYHDIGATGIHRSLVAIDLILVLLLWPAALDAKQGVVWRTLMKYSPALLIALGLFVIALLASFPTERHSDWFRSAEEARAECNGLRWFRFSDRLILSRESFVDQKKLQDIQTLANERGLKKAYLGGRMQGVRERDLSCARFDSVDLRRADFNGANLQGAEFFDTDLRGASLAAANLSGVEFRGFGNNLQETNFSVARLRGADLSFADLRGANLDGAMLQGAKLRGAMLQGARLTGAWLQGADLSGASLQGADLRAAQLQGANLSEASLQGANLGPYDFTGRVDDYTTHFLGDLPSPFADRFVVGGISAAYKVWDINKNYEKDEWRAIKLEVQLAGADLNRADLHGAMLTRARLEGADLTKAQLQSADLSEAQLAGARLDGASLALADLRQAYLWRATGAQCSDAQVVEPQVEVSSTAADLERFIQRSILDVPEPSKHKVEATLRARLVSETTEEQAYEKIWLNCEANVLSRSEWEKRRAADLIALGCGVGRNQKNSKYVANAMAVRFQLPTQPPSPHDRAIISGILGLDKPCSGATELDEDTKEALRTLLRSGSDSQ